MRKYIIKSNNLYSITESENIDINKYVIEFPAFNSGYGLEYQMSKFGITFRWTYGTYQGNVVHLSKNGNKFKSIIGYALLDVCNLLNTFNSYSELEFERIYSKYLEEQIIKLQSDNTNKLSEVNKLKEANKVFKNTLNIFRKELAKIDL